MLPLFLLLGVVVLALLFVVDLVLVFVLLEVPVGVVLKFVCALRFLALSVVTGVLLLLLVVALFFT